MVEAYGSVVTAELTVTVTGDVSETHFWRYFQVVSGCNINCSTVVRYFWEVYYGAPLEHPSEQEQWLPDNHVYACS